MLFCQNKTGRSKINKTATKQSDKQINNNENSERSLNTCFLDRSDLFSSLCPCSYDFFCFLARFGQGARSGREKEVSGFGWLPQSC